MTQQQIDTVVMRAGGRRCLEVTYRRLYATTQPWALFATVAACARMNDVPITREKVTRAIRSLHGQYDTTGWTADEVMEALA